MPDRYLTPQLLVVTVPDQVATVVEYCNHEWQIPNAQESTQVLWANPPEEALSIDHVRTLQSGLAYTALGSQRVVVITHLENASLPAQQALLKTLEEPPIDTQIILLTQSLPSVLPTIRSRCVQVVLPTSDSRQPLKLEAAAQLYQLLSTSSMAEVFEVSSEYSDRASALAICDELLFYLDQQLPQANLSHLQSLLTAREQLRQNANPRLVLEVCWLSWAQKPTRAQAPNRVSSRF